MISKVKRADGVALSTCSKSRLGTMEHDTMITRLPLGSGSRDSRNQTSICGLECSLPSQLENTVTED